MEGVRVMLVKDGQKQAGAHSAFAQQIFHLLQRVLKQNRDGANRGH